jgi:hypothetical protein
MSSGSMIRSEQVGGQVPDRIARGALADAGRDHATVEHLVEEFDRLGLRGQQSRDPRGLVLLPSFHKSDASKPAGRYDWVTLLTGH